METDKLRGMLWGSVVGSSLGVTIRGKDPIDLVDLCEDYVTTIPNTPHNKYPKGSWSALLEPLFISFIALRAQPIAFTSKPKEQTLNRNEFITLLEQFADGLKVWCKEGIRAWRDSNTPYDNEPQTLTVTKIQGYSDSPLRIAALQTQLPYDCGSCVRVISTATLATVERTEQITIGFTKVTHNTDSVAAINVFMALVLQGILHGERDNKQIISWPLNRLKSYIQGETRTRIIKIIRSQDLENIGGRDHIGKQLSVLRCFMWAYRVCASESKKDNVSPHDVWKIVMHDILRQGGATDVNAAIAGAVIGAWFGMSIVPEWRTELTHADWVEEQINEAVSLIKIT